MRYLKRFKYLFIILFIFSLASCTSTNNYLHRHDSDYLKNAEVNRPVQTPPNVYGGRLHDDYPVPDAGNLQEDHPASMQPPTN